MARPHSQNGRKASPQITCNSRRAFATTTKKIQSNRKVTPEKIDEEIINTTVERKEDATGQLYGKVIEHTNKIYRDFTSKFPHRSSKGLQYRFVLYDFDGNSIMVEPLKIGQKQIS
eukprot:6328032-Ditylum_brightwellii.AAC.1